MGTLWLLHYSMNELFPAPVMPMTAIHTLELLASISVQGAQGFHCSYVVVGPVRRSTLSCLSGLPDCELSTGLLEELYLEELPLRPCIFPLLAGMSE